MKLRTNLGRIKPEKKTAACPKNIDELKEF